jgi:hypothetical protein
MLDWTMVVRKEHKMAATKVVHLVDVMAEQ